ncbi:PAS domain-containing protein [Spongiibacter marinus]|uniref:PAS domain-containing protein n=1 Tax=Spongiibacter marinus TaxID=354246 RepID=UPI001960D1B0|nr:PAS domain-containing protein [Spongiibacter marinus]MBM7423388.1 PleD family two-component response regulator [Spongiibacter marinus]
MERSHEFLKMTLDTMSEHIAVIDETGLILYVNSRWRQFAEQNACTPHCEWKGQNYLSVCDRSDGLTGVANRRCFDEFLRW